MLATANYSLVRFPRDKPGQWINFPNWSTVVCPRSPYVANKFFARDREIIRVLSWGCTGVSGATALRARWCFMERWGRTTYTAAFIPNIIPAYYAKVTMLFRQAKFAATKYAATFQEFNWQRSRDESKRSIKMKFVIVPWALTVEHSRRPLAMEYFFTLSKRSMNSADRYKRNRKLQSWFLSIDQNWTMLRYFWAWIIWLETLKRKTCLDLKMYQRIWTFEKRRQTS